MRIVGVSLAISALRVDDQFFARMSGTDADAGTQRVEVRPYVESRASLR